MTQLVKVPTQATLQRTVAPILAQLTAIQQLISQLQAEVDDFSDGVDLSGYAKIADLDGLANGISQSLTQLQQAIEGKADEPHTHAIAQIEGLTEALSNLQSAIAGIPTPINRHPYLLPSAYPFTHFVGNLGEFSFGTSGTGARAELITGSTEGYGRLTAGTALDARGFVNTALQNMRLGQSIDRPDCFRARGYTFREMTVSDYVISQLGFMNNNNGNPSNGVFFRHDPSISPRWQCVAIEQGASTILDSSVVVAPSTNYDFKIEVQNAGQTAKFLIDGNEVGAISTNIPKTSGREVGVVAVCQRKAGSTTASLSLDHIGGGVRQSL